MQKRNGLKLEWSQFGRNYAALFLFPDWVLFFVTSGESEWAVLGRTAVRSEKDSYGPKHCPKTPSQTLCILCNWEGWLLIICLSWLPSEEKMQRCSLTLEGHWSQEQLISTGEWLCPPPTPRFLSPVSHCARLKTDRNEESSLFFCSEELKFESERWREASKGTCNWAALDRLSGNMKQQQLWRRDNCLPGLV